MTRVYNTGAFEHGVNWAKSFSGATVFLLDKNQLGDVQPRDEGMAISVHARN